MKRFPQILSLAFLLGATISCNNEIELYPTNAPEMLFVLGCLDGTGTLHQVKIRKLISGNKDASQMINDPTYYLPDTSLRVYLEEPSGAQLQMNRVMHPPQTAGVFAQDSNLFYELTGYNPSPDRTYLLRIESQDTTKEITAHLRSLKPVNFDYPTQESALHVKYNLTDPKRPFQVIYSLQAASILTISLKYVDVLVNGDTICRKANHILPPAFIPKPAGGNQFPLGYLWQIFDRSIKDEPGVDLRLFYSFDFTVWTGDSAIANYLYFNEKFSDNRKQNYSNIDGGMGLFFATSHAQLKNVRPYERFLSMLAINDTTAHLKFSGFAYSGVYTDPDSTLVNPFLPVNQ
jgi:hypothetical protein